MRYFREYASNTAAGTGTQCFFNPAGIGRGRIFYKATVPGRFRYSFLFTSVLDSTFFDGSVGHADMVIDSWEILSAKAAAVPAGITPEEFCRSERTMVPVTFRGDPEKTVAPGEFFSTDPVELEIAESGYLCLEIVFKGQSVIYHPEVQIPVFLYGEQGWKPGVEMPVPSMVGCDRSPSVRMGFWGDSITQGCGTTPDSYTHVAARVAGSRKDWAVWDLGLGYARGADAARLGAWFFKARQNDVVVVCFGVNDILHGIGDGETVYNNLKQVVLALKDAGVVTVIQTVPPFSMEGEMAEKRQYINGRIREELSKIADFFFDNDPVLLTPGDPELSAYGPHPDDFGHGRWTEAILPTLDAAAKAAVSRKTEGVQ